MVTDMSLARNRDMNAEYHQLRDKAERLAKDAVNKVSVAEERYQRNLISEDEWYAILAECDRMYDQARLLEHKASDVLKKYWTDKYFEDMLREQDAVQKDYQADQQMYSELRAG